MSTEGGVAAAPPRGTAIGASAIQLFTKTPNQWREPTLTEATVSLFRVRLAASGIRVVVAHDSYLINLASPDEALRERSGAAFTHELTRCRALGIPWVVSHPGNYLDDRVAGLERNARGYAACLAAVPGEVGILIEGTAGAGTALGATFQELGTLRDALPAAARARVAFCLDTAHLHAAGYDLSGAAEAVWERFDRAVGLDLLKCLHLNDSKAPPGSHLDRHEWIGEGTIGPEPFRGIMRDPRFAGVIKIIETPKADDPVRHDRRMLRRLRAYARRQPGRATDGEHVIALRTTRRRCTAPFAALLLVLQALAGGIVSLAHASEQFTAPIHIEAQHQSSCIPLHNELRCALCHYAATRVVPQQARVQPAAVIRPERTAVRVDIVPASDAARLTAPPRGPPPASL